MKLNLVQFPRTRAALCAFVVVGSIATSACGAAPVADSTSSSVNVVAEASEDSSTEAQAPSVAADPVALQSDGESTPADESSSFLSSDSIHTVSITFDTDDYDDMIAAFRETGDKEWIEANVTIDGVVYRSVGIRLKGNSSLMGVSRSDAETPAEELPWLIRMDKFIEHQSLDGVAEIVVRSNSSQTAMNEAVALDLLAQAGLASQDSALVRLSVNGSGEDLRLVVENLDDEWQDDNFDSDGLLYKAESSGDYSYRGDDPAAYEDAFDQETGDEDNLTPLIEFLEFINNSDDATFASELGDHLDVEAFATYLAFEELVNNFDDIDGPGNNSYLYWNADTGQFTVVAWDHNLAFGAQVGGAGGFEAGARGDAPDGTNLPTPAMGELPAGVEASGAAAGIDDGQGQRPRGMPGKSNTLVERFLATDEFAALVADAKSELSASLYDSGYADTVVEKWSMLVTAEASDLVDAETVAAEAAAIAKHF